MAESTEKTITQNTSNEHEQQQYRNAIADKAMDLSYRDYDIDNYEAETAVNEFYHMLNHCTIEKTGEHDDYTHDLVEQAAEYVFTMKADMGGSACDQVIGYMCYAASGYRIRLKDDDYCKQLVAELYHNIWNYAWDYNKCYLLDILEQDGIVPEQDAESNAEQHA